MKSYTLGIAEAFCSTDPNGCDTYRANAGAYADKLEVLEKEIRATINAIPQESRTVITNHDAFGYFAHTYGVKFLAPNGISTESEASAADVAKLIDQIRADGAAAVFVENVSDPRLIEQIASETGMKIGGRLFSDALSAPDGPAGTYINMMRHNSETIASATRGS